MRYRVYPLWDSPPTGKRAHGRPRQMLAGRAAEFCIALRRIPIIPQGCTCALLTICGLASFWALFALLRNRPADKGLPPSPAAW